MSLILRMNTQKVLDKRNLHYLHCDISSVKNLTIVNECGNTVCTVQGVKFSSLKPTNKEIDYVCNLLEDFLNKYESKIKDYYRLKKESNTLLEELNKNKVKFSVRFYRISNVVYPEIVVEIEDDIVLSTIVDKIRYSFIKSTSSNTITKTIEVDKDYGLTVNDHIPEIPKDVVKSIENIFTLTEKYKVTHKKLSDTKLALDSCSI